MSAELAATIKNSTSMLEQSLPAYEAGQLAEIEHVFGIASFYRSRGVAELLMRGVVDPLFIAQMQSVSAYLYGIARIPEDEKVTSLGACFWDAVGAQYRGPAAELAALSRMTHNPKREHEDDFLYVAFLMQNYFLTPPTDALPEVHKGHARRQQQRLERWEEVLEGALDVRLNLCHALLDHDVPAFEEAIVAMSDHRNEALEQRRANGRMRKEELAWLQPIWPEGLALLRLAERDGLVQPGLVVPRVPQLLLEDNPYIYHADAWRVLDARPAKRQG